MPARTLSVPDFDFTQAFYYGEILELLVRHKREFVKEITNESKGEVSMQMLSAFALVGHLNNGLLDMTAHESLMVTCQLRDSLVAHLKLIDFVVDGDIPATADLVLTLSKTFSATEEVVRELSLFGTRRRSSDPPLVYEVADAFEVTRTDQLTQVWVYDASGDSYTDRTTEANTSSSTWSVLPAVPAAGDALYVGHDTAMTNRLRVEGLATPMSGIYGVWEYCDDETQDEFPDSVTNLGAELKLIVDSLLDTDGGIDHTGLEVVVTLNSSGAQEAVTVEHDGTNNYVNTGFLGQSSPSTSELDYSVGTQWHRLEGLEDDTNGGDTTLEQNGNIDFILPQTVTRNWTPIEVNGVTAYWLRFRVVEVTVPVEAVVDRIYWNRRDNFILVHATQGRTAADEAVGSSTGLANQSFTLANEDVIPGSVVIYVDGTAWTEVENFLSSTSVDPHYTVTIDSDGNAAVLFGDGATGKIPPAGSNNITATYRHEAADDGNVGADTITVNRSGVGNVKRVTNPRPASGWVERRGATALDRERLKLEGPASLRTGERAVTADDVAFHTVSRFQTSDRRRPFVRAKGIEEGFGAKTIKVVTVGPAGAATTSADRLALEEYFNGDTDTGESGVIVANQRVFARDYTARSINVNVTVQGDITEEEVENGIKAYLSPVAVKDDGLTYRWEFGQTVTRFGLIGAIMKLDGVEDIQAMTQPPLNTSLDDDELPTYGTITVTVVSS